MLDVFGGSGSTLIAAEQCGRKACVLELDLAYCDTIVRRFEKVTGQSAILIETGMPFIEVEAMRSGEGTEAPTAHANTLSTGSNSAQEFNAQVASKSANAPIGDGSTPVAETSLRRKI